jgi:uncharacterized membrane-anchored protein YhcB (DUF1043 family)
MESPCTLSADNLTPPLHGKNVKSLSSKFLKGFITRKECLQMNQRHILLTLVILVMAGYLIYRFLNYFFTRKNELSQYIRQDQLAPETERLENLINTHFREDRSVRNALTEDLSITRRQIQEVSRRLDEVQEMLNAEEVEPAQQQQSSNVHEPAAQ